MNRGTIVTFIVFDLLFLRVLFECTKLIIQNKSIVNQLHHFTSRFNFVYTATQLQRRYIHILIDESLIVLSSKRA